MARPQTRPEFEVAQETELAPRYRVLVHNDDVTPMDFVVGILLSVFGLGMVEAVKKMMEAHVSGIAHVVTLPLEEAEHRCERAHGQARAKGFPLTFTYEPEA